MDSYSLKVISISTSWNKEMENVKTFETVKPCMLLFFLYPHLNISNQETSLLDHNLQPRKFVKTQ